MGNNISVVKYKILSLTHPRENKMLHRKFARGLKSTLNSLEQLARKAQVESSPDLSRCYLPFSFLKEKLYMCKTFAFYSGCLLSYSLISLGFRSIPFVYLGIFFSVVTLWPVSAQQNQSSRNLC